MQSVNEQKTIKTLGIIGLVSVIASQPEILGIVIAFAASLISVVATYWALYLLDKRFGGLNLFKVSIYQLVIYVPLMIVMLLFPNNPDAVNSQMHMVYILFGLMMALLLLIAFTNYKMAKKLATIAKLANNAFFKYAAWLLLISAYTMPFIIGLIFFALAIILFLIGCIVYKEPTTTQLISN